MDNPPTASNSSSVFRVVGTCGFTYWNPGPNGSGTDYHGPYMWTLQEMKSRW